MESYYLSLLTKRLLDSPLSLMSSSTLKELLAVGSDRTYYRIVNKFIDSGVLRVLEKNKYAVVGKQIGAFEIANFLYQPSYVSLETALNYWGVLSQFPYEVTSITFKKTVSKIIDEQTYSYSHMDHKYFGAFVKKDNVLIASPEKALFDQVYLAAKGLKTLNFDEYDFSHLDSKKVLQLCQQLQADQVMMKLMGQIIN